MSVGGGSVGVRSEDPYPDGGGGVSSSPNPSSPPPTPTDCAQDWERARYKRFLEIQGYKDFDEAIDILNREFPQPLKPEFTSPPEPEHEPLASGRPRASFCGRGHDLSVTRRFRPDGVSAGCARCHEDKKRERIRCG